MKPVWNFCSLTTSRDDKNGLSTEYSAFWYLLEQWTRITWKDNAGSQNKFYVFSEKQAHKIFILSFPKDRTSSRDSNKRKSETAYDAQSMTGNKFNIHFFYSYDHRKQITEIKRIELETPQCNSKCMIGAMRYHFTIVEWHCSPLFQI